MSKKWTAFLVIAIPLVLAYIYDCFSYKPPKMDIAIQRKIGSYARYDVSSLDDDFDNFVSYSINSLDANRIKRGKLKWNDDSCAAYICTFKEKDCVWEKVALEKENHLRMLKTAIKSYVMEYESIDVISLDGETFDIEFLDKKERLFYVLSINELPDSAEKAKGVFELLERISEIEGITWISENLIYTYFVGVVMGAIAVDFAYSIHLASKLRDYKELASLRFEDFKKEIRNRIKLIRKNKESE